MSKYIFSMSSTFWLPETIVTWVAIRYGMGYGNGNGNANQVCEGTIVDMRFDVGTIKLFFK